MSRRLSHLALPPDQMAQGTTVATRRLLLVEPGPFLSVLARDLPVSIAMVLCQFLRVDHSLIRRVLPDYVVAPLFSERFDIVELAQILSGAGYEGGLMVVSKPLPDWRLVVRELQSSALGMEVTFAEYDGHVLHWFGDWPES